MVDKSTIEAAVLWEKEVKVGDLVIAKWTNCGNYYETEVEVDKINEKSYVTLVKRPTGGYPVGHVIRVPRVQSRTWSRWNRLFPL